MRISANRPLAILAAVAVVLGGVAAAAFTQSASAATRVMPGSFTGYAFDACQAPDQEAMDAWRESSPYWGVGIYTSGVNRYCDVQENLSADWVTEQTRRGWRLLPLHVGLQAACSNPGRDWERIDDDPAKTYASARAQGRGEAREAAAAAKAYGIAAGSTLWYDLEHFDIGNTDCRRSALALVSAWTRKLHGLGYRSGLYSSASSGIAMLERARLDSTDPYTLPDQIWLAHHNGKQTTHSEYISDDGWRQDRVHQYDGTHTESYGGITLPIDSNFMDVGRGSRPGRMAPHCRVRVDFPAYGRLERGDRGTKVKAAQCFLKQAKVYRGKVNGRFTKGTARAVGRLQREVGLRETRALTGATWTALLSEGRTPVLKFGSGSNHVRRLQRALNAADRAHLDVSGVFARDTRHAVRVYQRDHGLERTGVVTDLMWALLQVGER